MTDDYNPRNYQDATDTGDNDTDPIIDEETDDPTEILGVSREEYKKEMDGLDIDDDTAEGNEDARERIEDADQNMGQGGK